MREKERDEIRVEEKQKGKMKKMIEGRERKEKRLKTEIQRERDGERATGRVEKPKKGESCEQTSYCDGDIRGDEVEDM